jgi:hypothetical protein
MPPPSSGGTGVDVVMGEGMADRCVVQNASDASDASITRKKGRNSEKQQTSRANTELELLKEFAELLADGASTTKALELAEKILMHRKKTTSAADSRIAGELVKEAVKEVLTEYGLTSQSQAKGPIYAAVAMWGMDTGLTRGIHASNAPKVIPARHGREIIVKVGGAGEDILKRAPADTVQALGVATKRKDAAAVRRLPSGDVAITFTESSLW